MGARTERLRIPLPLDRLHLWKNSQVDVVLDNGTTLHGRLVAIDAQQCTVSDPLTMALRHPNNLHTVPTSRILEITREIIGPF